mgnify:CR=1 FL=1
MHSWISTATLAAALCSASLGAHASGLDSLRQQASQFGLGGGSSIDSAKSIAVMATNMDTHNKNDPGGTYYTLENGPFFGVPYRCLIPRGISNLLVAGRSISADAMAGSAIRMIPCCLVFGQSAGTAAAMAASGACDPSRVDAQALRSLLLQQGAYLGQ